MPSNNFDVITLDVSGATYTAPANGYFGVTGVIKAANGYVDLTLMGTSETTIHSFSGFPLTGYWCSAFIPAQKGLRTRLRYGNMQGSSDTYPLSFRFYYVEGQASIIKY